MTRQLTRLAIDASMARITEALGHMDDFQTAALRQAVAASGRNTDQVEWELTKLAGRMNRVTVPAIVEALSPPPETRNNVPYHLPTCTCRGDGWVPGPVEHHGGRDYSTIARCDQGGPITPAMWDAWQRSAGQWTPPATDTDPITRRAAARRMTAAARAALPARPTTETTDAPQAI